MVKIGWCGMYRSWRTVWIVFFFSCFCRVVRYLCRKSSLDSDQIFVQVSNRYCCLLAGSYYQAVCLSLSTDGDKCAMVYLGAWTKRYLSIYLLYIVFLSFSHKIFSLATLALLRFILNLQMQACNVFYQPHLYIYSFFSFFGVIIPDCQLLKFTENMHKIAQSWV